MNKSLLFRPRSESLSLDKKSSSARSPVWKVSLPSSRVHPLSLKALSRWALPWDGLPRQAQEKKSKLKKTSGRAS